MNDLSKYIILGNTLYKWIIALSIIIGICIIIKLFKNLVLKRLKKWATKTTNN